MASTSKRPPDRKPSPADQRGPPNAKPRARGSRQGDPNAESVLPGREFGAGGQKEDGPDVTAGAGAQHPGSGGRASRP